MTLDFTSHTKNHVRPQRGPSQQDAVTSENPRQTEHGTIASEPRQYTIPNENNSNAAPESRVEPDKDTENANPDFAQEANANAPKASLSHLQILDLHSSNPLISYQGRTYSCQWASALGTDLLFAVPPRENPTENGVASKTPAGSSPGNPGPPTAPSRTAPKLDLIAATPVRLVATPSQIKKRPAPPASEPARVRRSPFAKASSSAEAASAPVHGGEVPGQPDDQGAGAPQLSFFERLRDIKRRRGEADLDFVPGAGETSRTGNAPEREVVINQRQSAVAELVGAEDDGEEGGDNDGGSATARDTSMGGRRSDET